MPDDLFMFWFIHIALGILVPLLALTGCCRREEEKEMKEREQLGQEG